MIQTWIIDGQFLNSGGDLLEPEGHCAILLHVIRKKAQHLRGFQHLAIQFKQTQYALFVLTGHFSCGLALLVDQSGLPPASLGRVTREGARYGAYRNRYATQEG